MKNQGCLYPFFAVFAIAGLCCGGFGAMNLMANYQLKHKGVKTTGVVTDLQPSQEHGTAPVVRFYAATLDSHLLYYSNNYTNPDAYEVGDSVALWYLPAHPEEILLEGDSWFGAIPLLFLFTHGGVGIGGLFWLERKRRLRNWLRSQGQEIQATVNRVDLYRGKSKSYYVVCAWKDPYSGISYEFKSDALNTDPEANGPLVGQSIAILIDPANPRRYWMDLRHIDSFV